MRRLNIPAKGPLAALVIALTLSGCAAFEPTSGYYEADIVYRPYPYYRVYPYYSYDYYPRYRWRHYHRYYDDDDYRRPHSTRPRFRDRDERRSYQRWPREDGSPYFGDRD